MQQAPAVATLRQPTLPPFTALVAAWGEGPRIEAHIQSFKAMRWPGAELIVVAGGKDDTYLRAKALEGEGVRVLEQKPGMGKQRSLREALKHARHDLIFLTDADCLFEREVLQRLFAPILEGRYQAVTGGSKPLPAQAGNPLADYERAREVTFFANHPAQSEGLLGRNAALTRRALEQAGSFAEDVSTGTDYHLAKKLREAGYAIGFVRESLIASEYPATAQSYLQRRRRWVKNLLVHDRQKNRPALIWGAAFALLILLAPLGLLLPKPLGWLLLLPALMALGARYRDMLRGGAGLKTLLLVPYFTVLDQIGLLGALWDYCNPERRRKW
ncbi:glycosyltransferase [Calidithermus timidus]|jgi:glycosyltransferase involved in cell wall biosynthesis|uniref:glycosyltransferase n=1 Tax=Calidithermus timidus TaxID=307124 RepID=UPI000371741B|nr:glycosyltransferase family 2 protein [Calidithermus timidus]